MNSNRKKSWNAPASRVRQLAVSICARSVRSTQMRPLVGSYIFASSFTSVDLPAPFSPTIATTARAGSVSVMSSSTSFCVPGYANDTCSSLMPSTRPSGAGLVPVPAAAAA